MQIEPKLEYKPLVACTPGELVRVPWANEVLSLVSHKDSRRFTVALQSDRGGRAPYYLPFGNEEQADVLSFGHSYIFKINTSGPSELSPNKLWELRGAILIDGPTPLLRIAPADELYSHGSGYLDLSTGEMVAAPKTNNYATFAHWELRLAQSRPEFEPPLILFNSET